MLGRGWGEWRLMDVIRTFVRVREERRVRMILGCGIG
jgi:hypothetical protein